MASILRAHHSDPNGLIIRMSAQILFISALAIVFLTYLKLPVPIASGLSLVLLFAGSLLCWRSFFAAQLILLLSIFAIEIAIVDFDPDFLFPALIIGISAIGALIFFGNRQRE